MKTKKATRRILPNNKILQIVVNEIIGAVGNMPKISLLLGDYHCISFPEILPYQDTDRHFNKKVHAIRSIQNVK